MIGAIFGMYFGVIATFEMSWDVVEEQGSHFNAKYALYISQCQFENDIIFIFLKYVKIFWH